MDNEGAPTNDQHRSDMAGNDKRTSIWESTPHWTYRRADRYRGGTALGEDFDPRSVQDTLYGRMCGLANRIKRNLPWR